MDREIARALVESIALENPLVSAAMLSRQTGFPDSTVRGWIRAAQRKNSKNTEFNELLTRHMAKLGGEKPIDKIAPVVKNDDSSVRISTQPPPNGGGSFLSRVLHIPDLHCPFQHPDALSFLQEVDNEYKTDKKVCSGDEIDAHAYSKWPKDPDGMSAGQELQAAREALIPFYKAFPEMQVCVSNHTIRPQKMMSTIGLPEAFFPGYSTMLNAPDKWTWHEHIIIDNVRYIHGDQGKNGGYGWIRNSEVYHQSVAVGHWHSKAGVVYDSDMFNLNSGCLIWPPAYAFKYARNSHKRPNLGCGIVIDGKEAHFIPMHTDKHGRWTGKL